MSYDWHRRSVEVVKYAAVEKSCAPLISRCKVKWLIHTETRHAAHEANAAPSSGSQEPETHVPAAPLHIVIILAPLLASPLAGWLWHRRSGPLLLAAIPAALTAYFAYVFSVVSRHGPFSVTGTWAPALNLSLSFRFDGLSTLFAMLITAVGTLIVIYAGKYLEHHPYAARFHVSAVRVHGLDARPRPQRQRHRRCSCSGSSPDSRRIC